MSHPRYAGGYPYPGQQGYYNQGPYPYQGPPVMAPPQYQYAQPPRSPGFLEGWYVRSACRPFWFVPSYFHLWATGLLGRLASFREGWAPIISAACRAS
ncbi:hypothetical protein Zm00014a_006637 [Zea mays]|uniref:Uncharacterized protein n=1 Tax=Zea mays TaxID=4577 RepID=A0A3L6DY85_MAIZE|nr:hypothetical protein Zm00014a_006637 [Zea mays]